MDPRFVPLMPDTEMVHYQARQLLSLTLNVFCRTWLILYLYAVSCLGAALPAAKGDIQIEKIKK